MREMLNHDYTDVSQFLDVASHVFRLSYTNCTVSHRSQQ